MTVPRHHPNQSLPFHSLPSQSVRVVSKSVTKGMVCLIRLASFRTRRGLGNYLRRSHSVGPARHKTADREPRPADSTLWRARHYPVNQLVKIKRVRIHSWRGRHGDSRRLTELRNEVPAGFALVRSNRACRTLLAAAVGLGADHLKPTCRALFKTQCQRFLCLQFLLDTSSYLPGGSHSPRAILVCTPANQTRASILVRNVSSLF